MKENCSALCSEYVIDGIRKSLTPWGLLTSGRPCPKGMESATVVDESIDPSPVQIFPDDSLAEEYASRILEFEEHSFPTLYSGQYTRIIICRSLVDTIWRNGHFRLCDLAVDLAWKWNDDAVGNMAAFYSSAESAAAIIDELSLETGDIIFEKKECTSFKAGISLRREPLPEDNEQLCGSPRKAELSVANRVPAVAAADPQSWVIYIPFDTCDFRLGGSALSKVMGSTCEIAPEVDDPDYFQDCFEIIREMVEDGVIVSGRSVGEGGLLPALMQYCPSPTGIAADISDILRSRSESVVSRVLFGEIPGVLIQIRDMDYDYFDAQMLLQDVEYFPLGHPGTANGVSICNSGDSGISRILESILRAQNHEGED